MFSAIFCACARAGQVIEGLKQEAAMKPSTLYHEILWLYADLLTRQKVKVDNVIRSCVRIYENNKNYVPALLCMATALFLNKQGPKARNQLKRIAKTPYSRDYAREFEESYLFLGSIYIESKKYDLALKMCKMCIKHNKVCVCTHTIPTQRHITGFGVTHAQSCNFQHS